MRSWEYIVSVKLIGLAGFVLGVLQDRQIEDIERAMARAERRYSREEVSPKPAALFRNRSPEEIEAAWKRRRETLEKNPKFRPAIEKWMENQRRKDMERIAVKLRVRQETE